MLLNTKHERLLAKHPQIFSPPFFPTIAGVSLTHSYDYVLIDYSEPDEPIATWLWRRLTLEGYLVWCRSMAPSGGTSLNETIQALVKQRAFRFISILSPEALGDPNLNSRRAMAYAIGTDRGSGFVIPIEASPINRSALDEKTKQLDIVSFRESWRTGLDRLLRVLETANCPRAEGGRKIALRSYMPENLLLAKPETVIANRFPVLDTPRLIYKISCNESLKPEKINELSIKWSFRQVTPQKFISFHQPPDLIREELNIKSTQAVLWHESRDIDGIATLNLIPELIRKTMIVESVQRGLCFCQERFMLYFPSKLLKSDRLYFYKPCGTRSFVSVVGQRKYWQPSSSSEYVYHLGPVFSVQRAANNQLGVVTRIKLRLTDLQGKVLESKIAFSRRKHLCGDWWNHDWLHRILAVMQFLANDGNRIRLGDDPESIITVSAVPDEWSVPIRINEDAIGNASIIRADVLERTHQDDEIEEQDAELDE